MPPPLQPHEALLHEAASRGHTPDTLPALRQYQLHRESGNLEAAQRIEENLRAFFEDPTPPESSR